MSHAKLYRWSGCTSLPAAATGQASRPVVRLATRCTLGFAVGLSTGLVLTGCRANDAGNDAAVRDAGADADVRADVTSASSNLPLAGKETSPDLPGAHADRADASSPSGFSDVRAAVPDQAIEVVPATPDQGRDSAPSCVTTPVPQANFPFPQNRFGSYCGKPTSYSNDDVQRAYCQWKSDTVTTSGVGGCPQGGCYRVQRPNEPSLDKDSTVSEGIGYGMLIAVVMNDQQLFDGLWKYEQQFLDQYGLMNWYIKPDGSGPDTGGTGGATDADEDMAFALIMADKQWGGQGSLGQSYLALAKSQITNVWNHEIINSQVIGPGDAWGDWSTLNISYFATSYYPIFAKVDSDSSHVWGTVASTCYDVIANTLNSANGNQSNGLVPAWASCSSTSCSPNANAFGNQPGQAPTNYQYDSCRVPFRIGLDYCWNGNPSAQGYLAKTSAFFSAIGASEIVDGYALNGTAQPVTPQASPGTSAAFIGPAAVGAMSSSSFLSFVNDAYASVATLQDMTGGTYYDDSWMMLSLLAMTGNFFDYTNPPGN